MRRFFDNFKNSGMLKIAGYVLALLIGLYAVRKVLQSLGIMKHDDELKTIEDYNRSLSTTMSALENTGSVLSQPSAYWAELADRIYNDLRYSSISDNKQDAIEQLKKVANDLDIYELIRLFGKRQEYLFGLPAGSVMGLAAFVGSNLSGSQIRGINDYYISKNIKFRL